MCCATLNNPNDPNNPNPDCQPNTTKQVVLAQVDSFSQPLMIIHVFDTPHQAPLDPHQHSHQLPNAMENQLTNQELLVACHACTFQNAICYGNQNARCQICETDLNEILARMKAALRSSHKHAMGLSGLATIPVAQVVAPGDTSINATVGLSAPPDSHYSL